MNLEHDLICPLKFKLCSGPVVRSSFGWFTPQSLGIDAEVAVFIE